LFLDSPLIPLLAWADAGVDPIDFPAAPTIAIPQALEKAGLTLKDISLFEINEAFSVVVRIAEKTLGIDPAKVNVNGYVPIISSLISPFYLVFLVEPLLSATQSETPVLVSPFPLSTHSNPENMVLLESAMG